MGHVIAPISLLKQNCFSTVKLSPMLASMPDELAEIKPSLIHNQEILGEFKSNSRRFTTYFPEGVQRQGKSDKCTDVLIIVAI